MANSKVTVEVVLTPKQRRFVEEYLRTLPNLNASEAARVAGYSPRNPDVAAAKQMRKPWVRHEIEERLKTERHQEAKRRRDRERDGRNLATADQCRRLVDAGYTLEEAATICGFELPPDERLATAQAMIKKAMAALASPPRERPRGRRKRVLRDPAAAPDPRCDSSAPIIRR